MTAPSEHWLEAAQVARADGGAEAQATLAALPADARRQVLELGRRIAEVSLVAAQAYGVVAPRARRSLGSEAFADWVELGLRLVMGSADHREALLGYFRLDPTDIVGLSPALRERWVEACRTVAVVSRRLAAPCIAGSGRALPRLGADAAERLDAWVRAGLGLAARGGWRGELLAAAWFEAGAELLRELDSGELAELAVFGLAVQPEREIDVGVVSALPAGWGHLTRPERRSLLQAARSAASADPRAGRELFGALPASLLELAPPVRSALLRVLEVASGKAPGEVAAMVPFLPGIVHGIPVEGRVRLLERMAQVAERFPVAAVRGLCSLPRAVEESGIAGTIDWIDHGERVARDNPEAGRAYFALESRTATLRLLAASSAARLEECRSVLRAYARMLSGRSVELRSGEAPSLRPSFDEETLRGEGLTLPERVDLFEEWEENFLFLRLMVAHGIGRLSWGTYGLSIAATAERLPPRLAKWLSETAEGDDLRGLIEGLPPADPLVGLFAACEGARVDACLRRTFRGYAADLSAVAHRLLRRAAGRRSRPELYFFLVGAGIPPEAAAPSSAFSETFRTFAAALTTPRARPEDALATAVLLREFLAADLEAARSEPPGNYEQLLFEEPTSQGSLEPVFPSDPETTAAASDVLDVDPDSVDEGDDDAHGSPLDPDELRRLLEAGARVRLGRGTAEPSAGIFVKGIAARAAEAPVPGENGPRVEPRRSGRHPAAHEYYYDEWDYRIGDYRQRWCRLEEIVLPSDGGEFFQEALARHADLLPEVRRQFQRLRPERLQRIRGLEDGEDFDLNAVIEAAIDRRARRTPSSRLYVARRREERDVATLFLVDTSASTDQPVVGARRIVDILKESLVIMAEALDELGDRYAIYGFSGQGREHVEFYPVKHFHEGLTPAVRGRIGGIEPRRSTRMGAALRHAITKLANLPARSKHLLLLSDGFPQDFDYGEDRRSNAYALHDTATALQECQLAGISPFCITVDRTGHDYLRQMCERSRYLVIEDVGSLPAELPKIYERFLR